MKFVHCFFWILGGISMISGCTPKETNCICFSTPSFPLSVRYLNSTDSKRIYLLISDTTKVNSADTIYIGNRFKSVIKTNGVQRYQFIFNESDELYKGKHLSAFYFVFINSDSNFVDTLQYISWDEENISPSTECTTRDAKKCVRMSNISFISKKQKYYPLEEEYVLW